MFNKNGKFNWYKLITLDSGIIVIGVAIYGLVKLVKGDATGVEEVETAAALIG